MKLGSAFGAFLLEVLSGVHGILMEPWFVNPPVRWLSCSSTRMETLLPSSNSIVRTRFLDQTLLLCGLLRPFCRSCSSRTNHARCARVSHWEPTMPAALGSLTGYYCTWKFCWVPCLLRAPRPQTVSDLGPPSLSSVQ